MLRGVLLGLSRSSSVEHAVVAAPPTRAVLRRFVAGEAVGDALAAARRLVADGLLVTVDHVGADTTDRASADAAADAYEELLEAVGTAGLGDRVEVSAKLSALGLRLADGPAVARANAGRVCRAAEAAGTTVTLDPADSRTTDATLAVLRDLRREFPSTGAALRAHLRRTQADCHDLARPGSRVRLCRGAEAEPPSDVFVAPQEVDLSYVRCLRVLVEGGGYPVVATHDLRLVAIARYLAKVAGLGPRDWELQMPHGVRPAEQRRLARLGHQVRVRLPYGTGWYRYLVRRLADGPADLALVGRALLGRD